MFISIEHLNNQQNIDNFKLIGVILFVGLLYASYKYIIYLNKNKRCIYCENKENNICELCKN